MRAGLDESVQLMEQREMNTNIEYVTLFSSNSNVDRTLQHGRLVWAICMGDLYERLR